MDDIFKFLSGFFSVETIIGLIAATVAGAIFLIAKSRRLMQIKGLVKRVEKEQLSDTIVRLAEDLGFNLEIVLKGIKSEPKRIDIVKQAMKDKHHKFIMQIRLIWGGIIFLTLLILSLVVSKQLSAKNNDVEKNQTNEKQLPVFNNDSLTQNKYAKQVIFEENESDDLLLSNIWKNVLSDNNHYDFNEIKKQNDIISIKMKSNSNSDDWLINTKKRALHKIALFMKHDKSNIKPDSCFIKGTITGFVINEEEKNIILTFKPYNYEQ